MFKYSILDIEGKPSRIQENSRVMIINSFQEIVETGIIASYTNTTLDLKVLNRKRKIMDVRSCIIINLGEPINNVLGLNLYDYLYRYDLIVHKKHSGLGYVDVTTLETALNINKVRLTSNYFSAFVLIDYEQIEEDYITNLFTGVPSNIALYKKPTTEQLQYIVNLVKSKDKPIYKEFKLPELDTLEEQGEAIKIKGKRREPSFKLPEIDTLEAKKEVRKERRKRKKERILSNSKIQREIPVITREQIIERKQLELKRELTPVELYIRNKDLTPEELNQKEKRMKLIQSLNEKYKKNDILGVINATYDSSYLDSEVLFGKTAPDLALSMIKIGLDNTELINMLKSEVTVESFCKKAMKRRKEEINIKLETTQLTKKEIKELKKELKELDKLSTIMSTTGDLVDVIKDAENFVTDTIISKGTYQTFYVLDKYLGGYIEYMTSDDRYLNK